MDKNAISRYKTLKLKFSILITEILANTSEGRQKNEDKKYKVCHNISAKLKQNRIYCSVGRVIKRKEQQK
jgi:hypothetical protein